MRMSASWSGSNDPTAYRSYAVGGKTLVNRRRPSLSRGSDHATRYHSCCSRADLQPERLCHFVSLIRAESFDLGCNGAGARQQQDVQAHARRRDGHKLLDLLARLKSRAEQRIAAPVKVVTIHEVGLDGFWIHRLLEANGVESHV